MRHPTPLAVLVLVVGLTGCDSPNAAAASAAPAAAAPPGIAAPAPVATSAPQDGAQDMPVPPVNADVGLIPRGQAPRPPQTLAEMQSRNDQIFARLDANADGAVTGDELATLTSGPMGARGGGRLREMIARADADRNARITLDELRAATARRFARMDADGDGVVTDEERPDRP